MNQFIRSEELAQSHYNSNKKQRRSYQVAVPNFIQKEGSQLCGGPGSVQLTLF